MSLISRYRSLALCAVVGAAMIPLAGCGSSGADHTQKVRGTMTEQWKEARVRIVYQLAKQQYEAGEYDKCRETLAQASSLTTPHATLNILAAKLEIEKGNLDVAYDQLKEAQLADPSNAEGFYLLGVVYQRWQKTDEAIENYNLAWEKKPSEAGYMLAVVEMMISTGKLDEAKEMLETKLSYFEQTAAVRVALGKVYALKHDYINASKYYRDAVLLTPDNLAVRQIYAEALYFAGKYADALPVLEDLRKNPDVADKSSLTMLLGRTYMGLRRARDARLCFQDLTQENPNNVLAWLSLGRVYLLDNEPVLAIQTAQRVLKLEPENVQAMILQALSEQKQHRWNESVTTLETAHRVAPKDSTVLCLMGVSRQGLGEKEKATVLFEQAVTANPQDAWAQELLASAKPAEVPESPVVTKENKEDSSDR